MIDWERRRVTEGHNKKVARTVFSLIQHGDWRGYTFFPFTPHVPHDTSLH